MKRTSFIVITVFISFSKCCFCQFCSVYKKACNEDFLLFVNNETNFDQKIKGKGSLNQGGSGPLCPLQPRPCIICKNSFFTVPFSPLFLLLVFFSIKHLQNDRLKYFSRLYIYIFIYFKKDFEKCILLFWPLPSSSLKQTIKRCRTLHVAQLKGAGRFTGTSHDAEHRGSHHAQQQTRGVHYSDD